MILPPGVDVHSFEPNHAVFLKLGLLIYLFIQVTLEVWAIKLLPF